MKDEESLRVLAGGEFERRSGEDELSVKRTSSGRQSSMGWWLGRGEAELVARTCAVEVGRGLGAFYSLREGGEAMTDSLGVEEQLVLD
jgi:hypothetical protein